MSTSTIFPNPSHTIGPRANVIDIGRFLPRSSTQVRRATRAKAARTGELSITRNFLPFEILRRVVLPEVMTSGQHHVRIAVAGPCTAHQAFGLAITVCEHFPELAAWDLRIVAENSAEAGRPHADRGCFQHLDRANIPLPLLLKYFQCKPGHWQATSRLRSLVDFRPHRVFNTPGRFDMVLLHDAFTRLSTHERRNAMLNLHGSLQPHAVVVGNRDHLDAQPDLFTPGADGPCGFYRPFSS